MNITSAGLQERVLLIDEQPWQFMVLGTQVALMLGWQVTDLHEWGFTATPPAEVNPNGEILTIMLEARSAYIYSEYPGKKLPDEEKSDEHLNRFVMGLWEIRYYFSQEEMRQIFLDMQPHIIPAPPPPPAEDPGHFLPEPHVHVKSFFGAIRTYLATSIIIAINVIVFAAMVAMGADILEPPTGMMVDWGANYGSYTLHGEWWRLLTACFLHYGVVHLLSNMYALVYIGILLEPYLGWRVFTTAYLLTGIAASTVSVWWHPFGISAGASGAVFGMYGVLMAMLSTRAIEPKLRKTMLISIGFFVVYSLANGMKEGIDNAAHIGGLFTGMLLGYLYIFGIRRGIEKHI